MFEIFLPIAGITINALSVILLGTLIGIISGLFGVGGGFMLTPFLNVLLGIPYNIAVGSSLAQMVFTAFSGVIRHFRQRNIDLKLAAFFISGAFAGILVGVMILESFSSDRVYCVGGQEICEMDLFMTIIYLFFLLLMGSYMIFETFRKSSGNCEAESAVISKFRSVKLKPLVSFNSVPDQALSIWPIILVGTVVGFLCGLLGIGGGFILLPVLIYVVGVPTRMAVGTSLMQTFASAVFGSFSHFINNNVDFILVMFLVAGSVIGAQAGAFLTMKIDCVSIRKYFGFLVLCAAGIVALKFL